MKNKIWLLVVCLFFSRSSIFSANPFDKELHDAINDRIHNNNECNTTSPAIFTNWSSAIQDKFQTSWNNFKYLGTHKGAHDSLDFVIGVVGLIAYIYFITYVQTTALNNQLQQEGMQIYYPGDIIIKLSDVAGLSGAKADVQDIITYLKEPSVYKNIGARVPKGVLMNGAPGNGKTMLARALAGEVNCPFISMNGSAFIELYVGLGAQRVRAVFGEARRLACRYGACIIFIDEIDAVAMARSSGGAGGHNEHDQTLNALLAEMDGLDQSGKPVIVIGATNRAHLLDEAIVRPGRFDRKVEVSKLNIKDRLELLQLAVKKIKTDASFDIHRIARFTRGFSGAELANLINEAAIIAANSGKKIVTMTDIELAFDTITLGREIKGMEQSHDQQWKTAIHEAGHTIATIACDTCNILHKVSIVPRSNTLGVMRMLPLYEAYEMNQVDMENNIVIALAGRLAEEEFGMGLSSGASSDLQTAHTIAYEMVAFYGMSDALKNIAYNQRHQLSNDIATQVEREVQKIIDRCTQRCKILVAQHKYDIEKIAHLLIEKGTVVAEEVYQLLDMAVPVIAEVA